MVKDRITENDQNEDQSMDVRSYTIWVMCIHETFFEGYFHDRIEVKFWQMYDPECLEGVNKDNS